MFKIWKKLKFENKVKRANEIEEESLHNLFNVRTEKEEELKEIEAKSEEAAEHRLVFYWFSVFLGYIFVELFSRERW